MHTLHHVTGKQEEKSRVGAFTTDMANVFVLKDRSTHR